MNEHKVMVKVSLGNSEVIVSTGVSPSEWRRMNDDARSFIETEIAATSCEIEVVIPDECDYVPEWQLLDAQESGRW